MTRITAGFIGFNIGEVCAYATSGDYRSAAWYGLFAVMWIAIGLERHYRLQQK